MYLSYRNTFYPQNYIKDLGRLLIFRCNFKFEFGIRDLGSGSEIRISGFEMGIQDLHFEVRDLGFGFWIAILDFDIGIWD